MGSAFGGSGPALGFSLHWRSQTETLICKQRRAIRYVATLIGTEELWLVDALLDKGNPAQVRPSRPSGPLPTQASKIILRIQLTSWHINLYSLGVKVEGVHLHARRFRIICARKAALRYNTASLTQTLQGGWRRGPRLAGLGLGRGRSRSEGPVVIPELLGGLLLLQLLQSSLQLQCIKPSNKQASHTRSFAPTRTTSKRINTTLRNPATIIYINYLHEPTGKNYWLIDVNPSGIIETAFAGANK